MSEDLRLAKALIDDTLMGYALEYITLDGKPFDFIGHNYLIEPYQDKHPYQVIEKAAQMGASILGIAKALFVCDRLSKNVIYYFPTDEDVREFSKSRVKPIIEESPHIKGIVDDVDSISLRQVGKGFLYFRGMKSSIRMRSVPADMLVFDELDEVTDDQLELADQRLNHSSLRWRFMLSTPTFDGYGIDREFKMSDQKYWNLVCKKCGTYNILEKTFPDCVRVVDEITAYLICRKCKGELDTQYGYWIADAPKNKRIRGYHLCGLYSTFMDLPELMAKYHSGRKRESLMRDKLGLPYVSADQRVTDDMIVSRIGNHEMGPLQTRTFMGVDQKGDELHVVIRTFDKITNKPKVLYVTKVAKFNELSLIMQIYDVELCVVDALPNQHSAREFCAKHPGKVYMCYYVETQKGDYKWLSPKPFTQNDQEDWQVAVNRTEAIDAMYEEFFLRQVVLPRMDDATLREFTVQLCNLARVNDVDDDGNIKAAIWKRLGPDHFAHANSYSAIAASRFGNDGAASVVIQSPLLSTVQYSKRYERGSRY